MSGHEHHEIMHLLAAGALLGVAALILGRAWFLVASGSAGGATSSGARRDRLVIAGTMLALGVMAAVLLVSYWGGLEGGAAAESGAHAGH